MVAVACVVWFWFGLVWGGAVGGRRRVERSKRRDGDGSGDRGGTSVSPCVRRSRGATKQGRESNIEIDMMTSVRAAIDDGEFAGRSVLGLGQPRETYGRDNAGADEWGKDAHCREQSRFACVPAVCLRIDSSAGQTLACYHTSSYHHPSWCWCFGGEAVRHSQHMGSSRGALSSTHRGN